MKPRHVRQRDDLIGTRMLRVVGLSPHNRLEISRQAVEIGARSDHLERYSSQFSPRLSAVVAVRPELTTLAAVGRAFAPPAFDDLFRPPRDCRSTGRFDHRRNRQPRTGAATRLVDRSGGAMARKLHGDTSYPSATKASYGRAKNVVMTQSTQGRGPSNTGRPPLPEMPSQFLARRIKIGTLPRRASSNSFCRSDIRPRSLFFLKKELAELAGMPIHQVVLRNCLNWIAKINVE